MTILHINSTAFIRIAMGNMDYLYVQTHDVKKGDIVWLSNNDMRRTLAATLTEVTYFNRGHNMNIAINNIEEIDFVATNND